MNHDSNLPCLSYHAGSFTGGERCCEGHYWTDARLKYHTEVETCPMVMEENVLIFRKQIKYLGIKGYDVCNLLSSASVFYGERKGKEH